MNTLVKQKRKYETRKLGSLIPFPLQESVFSKLTDAEEEAFLDDIRENGVRDFIQVLPDNTAGYPTNTIICGHRRCNALITLGHKDHLVCVRYDLANAPRAKIDRLFLLDNSNRRQLKGAALMRCILRLAAIERGRDPGTLRSDEITEVRERIGQRMGMQGRNIDRYLNLGRAPINVQEAFDAGLISLVVGAKVGAATIDIKVLISKLIAEGESPAAAIQQVMGATAVKAKTISVTLASAVKTLQGANQQLERVIKADKLGVVNASDAKVIKQTMSLCEKALRSRTAKPRKAK